jgi:hypothetical protein
MEAGRRRLIVALSCSCLVGSTLVERAFAAARDSIYVVAKGACPNGSALWVVGNNDQASGIVATLQQTTSASGTSFSSAMDISLNSGEEKTLGCEVQELHPGPATARFAWLLQDARYR